MLNNYSSITFWIALFLVFYAYIGYGILMYILVVVKRLFITTKIPVQFSEPEVTIIIPAYNEISCIAQKVINTQNLNYPKEKLHILFVTEGSTDGTTQYLQGCDGITVIGGSERRGKIEAINLAMQQVKTPIVIFTDANTALNKESVNNIVRYYADPNVGAVSGEKRILSDIKAEAAEAGEGFYWKYESFLKRLDAELNTIVGAAGELFSMRTELYKTVEKDTLLDDFIISLRVAGQGYKVVYEPEAYALERPSFSIQEEMKRKIRICTGGFQSIFRLGYLLNPFRYGTLTFQYISHRVLRWAVAPFCLPVIFITNLLLYHTSMLYETMLLLQIIFYILALTGYVLEKYKLRSKALFIPFYFSFMNYSVYLGLGQYLKGVQGGTWEKVKRA